MTPLTLNGTRQNPSLPYHLPIIMKIIISDIKKIEEIQAAFKGQFPHLKLQFFEHKGGQKPSFTSKDLVKDTTKKIGELREFRKPDTINFNGNQKVSTLESRFRDQFGLNVQVFRRSGRNWLETGATDFWTLSRQNKEGAMSVKNPGEAAAQDFDAYHEQL